MNPESLKLENLPGNNIREKRVARRQLVKEEQENLQPPIVPAAFPPTTMAEVPPGIAPITAAPARKPGDRATADNDETTAEENFQSVRDRMQSPEEAMKPAAARHRD
jgi:hypothetical protein